MSFAYLKGGKDKVKSKRKEQIPVCVHEEIVREKEIVHKEAVQPLQRDQLPEPCQGIQIGNRLGLSLSDGLMASRFCYGCIHFSVDSPGTDKEVGFCLRELPPEAMFTHEWKVIRPQTLIRQCPRVKSGDLIINVKF